ncbi:MAG: isoprenylcysteine carboxylmethyltransferase family protein [Bacteroidales bacterium]|jgi:protein-S-isoprenylcysteine O-methyltransferase Ste14|nr:isoprenylcysteine carboxylmethyltransferase family protein [Bacteroidales bacterium]MDD4385255.1 isoprenylcysteine carboxylmethyltransferase family protein [Bacteroidales bacterium]MDY0198006.1 isoprenylcysteine carboxylmethyltransferase family protein [Tenuifilaceae bacterium]
MALMEDFRKQGNFLFKYRSYFPIPLFIFGFGVHLYSQYTTNGEIVPEYFFAICFGVSFLGLIARSLVIGFVPKNTSGRNTKEQIAKVLNTKGAYSIVRHPLYVGNFLMWLGIALLTANGWFILFFILFYWLYYERIMYAEEAFLRDKFGQDYLDWANSVPSFIPKFSQWEKPDDFFSFKNVLRREYTGLFFMVIIFFVFHYAHVVIKQGMNFMPNSIAAYIWLGAFAFVIVFYFTIRFLHKKTKVLSVEGR